YMSPEQLEGAEADSRSDIFSLGSVLYEMATGQKAFAGKSQASLIASILDRQPAPLSSVLPLTPPAFEHIVSKCLEKDPEHRWQSAQDVSGQLRWIGQESSRAGVPKAVSTRRKSRARLAWGMVAALGVAVVALAALMVINRPRPPEIVRFQFAIPEDARWVDAPRISPDGRMILFTLGEGSQPSLAIRSLDDLEVRKLPGTERADKGVWSPDSRYVAFISDGKLRKVSVAGGPSQVLADAPAGDDGFWTENGEILFDAGATDPIRRVAEGGGVSQAATVRDTTTSVGYGWPEGLPGGKTFLCLGIGTGTGGEDGFPLFACEVETGELTEIGRVGSQVRWAEPGVLLSVSERTLVAQPFDPKRLEFTGEPVPIVEGIGVNTWGQANFSVSRNGTLVYRPLTSRNERLVWRDSAGRLIQEFGEPGRYQTPGVSPDGRRIAVERGNLDDSDEDVWVLDTERGTSSRLTFSEGRVELPIWSPDGRSVAYAATSGGEWTIYRTAASGVGSPEALATFASYAAPCHWSPDGKILAVAFWGGESQADLCVLHTDGSTPPDTLMSQPYMEWSPRFSPDGRWLAYVSEESGRFEVYVRTFPGPEGKWQISTQGGGRPLWSRDGTTLYYVADSNRIMAVEIDTTVEFRAGVPSLVFENSSATDAEDLGDWTDGERFLFVEAVEDVDPEPFTVVMNWARILDRR
ncbi:MAG TPA: protein kinase, partial [bacterium]|nr:protein kinase [bacterium]